MKILLFDNMFYRVKDRPLSQEVCTDRDCARNNIFRDFYNFTIKYENKVKSFRPILRETLDQRSLSRDPDRNWCHRHTTSMIKLFLVTWFHGHRRQHTAKVKALGLAYNRRETRDKWPLGRDPDRSWCHSHISVKLSWSQHESMD